MAKELELTTQDHKVIEMCQRRIESINDYHVMVTKAANSE